MFIFLGWFLLSVKNNNSSNRFIPVIGYNVEKFKKGPSTRVVTFPEFILYDIITLSEGSIDSMVNLAALFPPFI